ncbi:uncharacterized protein GIQ15_06004 [Arthroderma uncinatum]|uniref:uncharacterized protein n=1 Tax=Arthroderma uncinatum TaxID=74035 RepID=UPI00144A4ECE|nr:uncharacterized protein GIQ15_06004 [Arthroderma uncinatum]KAF3480657.1 hypothetical protein GIQ15_06004 [Arthroderma uncinatum]
MVSLATVRASNQGLKAAIPGLTALFVGGTTGIGQSTLRQLAIHAEKPKVYIIGRSESKASPFLEDLRKLNPQGSFNFIEQDVSLMRNVDSACEAIKSKEGKLNLLFMTPGGISLSGRQETSEGIDHLFALRYYSRMRFIQNLLPLLDSATPARVISIFGGGFEFGVNPDDLDLKHNYSIINCAKHAITMTSLAMEHLASSHPSVSFMHIYPGLVRSNIYTNSFPPPMAAFYNYVAWPMMWPFSVNVQECGERHLFHLTSGLYAPKKGSSPAEGVPVPGGLEGAIGSTGQVGGGAYLLNWKGEGKQAPKTMQKYREEGMPDTVWKHTVDLISRAAGDA